MRKQLPLVLLALITYNLLFAHDKPAGEKIFACATPSSVNTTAITQTSVLINFTAAGTDFIVEYGAAGFIPGTGATAGGGTIVTGTSSPIGLNSLSSGTVYDVYVRQVCVGPEYSINSTVVQFKTLCDAVNVPYLENFDAVAEPAVPLCINVQNVNGGNTWRTVGTDFYVSAPNIMRVDYELDGVTPADDWFFTRGLNLTGGVTYRLLFKYRNSDATVYTEKLEVKYGPAPVAASMTAGTLFSNTSIDFNIWQEGGADFTPASTGVYYIGFHGFSNADQAFLAIDDISVDITPACAAPVGVTVGPITPTTATVNFTSPGTNFIVEYGLSGFTPGLGASAGIGGTVIPATGSPVVLTGLTTLADYDVYIRQICTGPVYGPNSTVTAFRTVLVNDNAPGAFTVTVGAGCTGEPYTNAGGTQSAGEPYGSCSSTTGYATVWYKFAAPVSGAVRISTANGSGTNTLTNSRVALFSATDVNDYSTFSIISCDEDGGAGSYGLMSVLYATGLTAGNTYYIQVDAFNNANQGGTFCLAVDELNASMLSATGSCAAGQAPVGTVPTYTGWVSLVDTSSRLIAMVRNPAGGSVSAYSVSQHINVGAARSDVVSGEYYLDRNFSITNAEATNVEVRLFFLSAELTALQAMDAAASLPSLAITRQTGACQADFGAANGTNSELVQTGNGSTAGVSWVNFTTPGFSNFFIHSQRADLIVRAYLQGAYLSGLGRHKNVLAGWATILNANALSQPYNTPAFGNYAGTETVSNGFFAATADTTDVIDWVLVEIKNSSNGLIARRAAFIREDGYIVDLDGISPVRISGLAANNYHITIRHRNHLGISTQNMTAINAKALGVASVPGLNFDFTSAPDVDIFGTSAAYKIVGGKNVMVGGNANSNNNVKYGGPSNDPFAILIYLGSNPTIIVNNVYTSNDVNMDGSVKYGGPSNDPSFILITVLGGSPLVTITEQKR